MDESGYRAALYKLYGVFSTKDLTSDKASKVIDSLTRLAVKAGVWGGNQHAEAFDHLVERPGFATPKQLGLIAALWRELRDNTETEEASAQALRTFLQRAVKVSDLRFLKKTDVQTVVSILKQRKGGRGYAKRET